MIFELYTIPNQRVIPKEIISYELTSEISAACDGLRLNFCLNEPIGEIKAVQVKDGNRLIFNGFADKQKVSFTQNGFLAFVYARSSAALLVDNEAEPCQYNHPTAKQLWLQNAKELGFDCDLPDICCEHSYFVPKGTSCFGAINEFVSMLNGRGIYVSPDNVIRVYKKGEKIKNFDEYEILNASYVINRSEVLSGIDYKINAADKYIYHLESPYAVEHKIQRRQLLNLSSLPAWERKAKAAQKISKSLLDCYALEISLSGNADFMLADRVQVDFKEISASGEFLVYEIVREKNRNTEKTTLVLKKEIQEEFLNYVAE